MTDADRTRRTAATAAFMARVARACEQTGQHKRAAHIRATVAKVTAKTES